MTTDRSRVNSLASSYQVPVVLSRVDVTRRMQEIREMLVYLESEIASPNSSAKYVMQLQRQIEALQKEKEELRLTSNSHAYDKYRS